MDAILGRDDRLVDKLCDAAKTIDASFAAIVGTPVPSVIGTDYKALKRMAEKRLSLPVVTVDTTGMDYYDKGIEKAYEALFPALIDPSQQTEADTVGVLGAVPLELMHPGDIEWISQSLVEDGWQQILLFDEIEDYRKAGKASLNLVVSPAGLKAAQYLKETFGTPYELHYFGLDAVVDFDDNLFAGKNVLIIHQQVAASAMAAMAEEAGAAYVTTASWFMELPGPQSTDHVQLQEEDDLRQLADNDHFDVILGDAYFRRALPNFPTVSTLISRISLYPGGDKMYTERICVFGIVQGVGFRPFVSRIATAHSICGTVCNKGSYVEILAQGSQSDLAAFREDLESRAPERSAILKVLRESEDRPPYEAFSIIESAREEGDIFVSPDIAICDACKKELFDKTNRRYLPSLQSTARPAGRG